MRNQKKTFVQKFQIQLNEWGSRIKLTNDMAKAQKKPVPPAYEKKIGELKIKEKAARALLDKLKAADEKEWQDHKLDVQNAIEGLKKSVQETFVDVVK